MKIAIKGHKSRGKEVIQILESLGGKNKWFHFGNNENCFYELHDDCIWCANTRSEYFKYYTLEEFEKEFPFKIGDKVITPLGHIGTIISIKDNKYEVFFKIDSALISPKRLKLYKEMKEERNITLTLDKAKEWYKKGGDLKEIALQAFSEKELNPLPRSWEEFCENYPVQKGECWLSDADDIPRCSYSQHRTNKNWIPSKKSAEAHLALIQLEQLRNCWWGDWEPEWNRTQAKYCIIHYGEEFKTTVVFEIRYFLSFPTREMAEEFLKCFRDLIEKAGDLI